MKPNKQLYIDFILNELEKGNVQYKDVMLVFVSKFQLTEKTFCIYWKTANTQHTERLHERNKVIEEERTALAKETLKKDILTKHQALEILTEIAQGKAKKVEGQIIMPSPNERKGAIETMMKMEGWTAPIKTENTNIELKQPFFGNMDLDE